MSKALEITGQIITKGTITIEKFGGGWFPHTRYVDIRNFDGTKTRLYKGDSYALTVTGNIEMPR